MSKYVVRLNEKKNLIDVVDSEKIIINGESYNYKLLELSEDTYQLIIENKSFVISVKKLNEEEMAVYYNGKQYLSYVRTLLQEKASELLEQKEAKSHQKKITAPMPGLIVKIKKQVEEPVEKGETIMILEAMKMENEIKSPGKGVVKSIAVNEGMAVEKNAILFMIE